MVVHHSMVVSGTFVELLVVGQPSGVIVKIVAVGLVIVTVVVGVVVAGPIIATGMATIILG